MIKMKDFNHPGALYVKGEALYHLGKFYQLPCDWYNIGKTIKLKG